MSQIEVRYRLKLLNSNSPEADEVAAALKIYSTNTPPEEKTAVREIEYWLTTYNKTFDDKLLIFGFYKNGKIIGYAQVVCFVQHSFVQIDYLTLSPEAGRNNTFYECFEGIRAYLDKTAVAYDYVLAELVLSPMDGAPSRNSQIWEQLLRLQGFHKIHAPYFQPQMGENIESETPAFLMIYSREQIQSLRTEMYFRIIDVLYYDHYLRWHSPFLGNNLEEFRNSLGSWRDKIIQGVGDAQFIKVNGSLVTLPAEPVLDDAPPGVSVLSFTAPSILIVSAISILMIVLSRKYDVSNATVVTTFFVSLIIYFALLATQSRRVERIFGKLLEKLKAFGIE